MSETPPKGGMYPIISVSQMNCYLSCPRKYEYQYVKGISSQKSSNLIFGSSIHSALEHHFRIKQMTNTPVPKSKLVDLFAEQMDRDKTTVNWDNEKGVNKYGSHIDMGRALLVDYVENFAPSIKPLRVEQQFKITLPNIEKKLLGFIDLINTGYTVIDYKTTARTPSDVDIRRNLFQLSGYSFAILNSKLDIFTEREYKELHSLRSIPVRLDFFVKSETQPKIVVKTFHRDLEDLKRFVHLSQQINHAINQGVFYPNLTNPLCSLKYCSYYERCNKELHEDSFLTNDR